MSFYINSKDISIQQRGDRTFLVCQSLRNNQTWTNAEIDLDKFIGNIDGRFNCSGTSSGFTQSAGEIRLEKDPRGVPILRASLRNEKGEWRESCAYPADWIRNIDGNLVFRKPQDLRDPEVVSDDRTFLICQTQREDGSWVLAKIDLDEFIGNDDGKFDSTGTMSGFTQSAKKINLRFEGPDGNLRPVVKASLRCIGGEWREASLDLLEVVRNDDGKLVPLTGNKP